MAATPRTRPRICRKPKEEPKKVELGLPKKYFCEYCPLGFRSERTLFNHLCEGRRRFEQKDSKHVIYGFEAWNRLMNRHGGVKIRTNEEFRESQFYLACVRWGRYVIDVHCFNPTRYLEWLVRSNIPIEKWTFDQTYDKWILTYLFMEDPWDSITRSIQTINDQTLAIKAPAGNYFSNISIEKVMHDIKNATITGWVIYNCNSGRNWIANLTNNELESVWTWIDAEKWQSLFDRFPDVLPRIQSICNEIEL